MRFPQLIQIATQFLLIVSCTVLALHAHGQGTVLFSNLGPGVDAPVTNIAGTRIVGPGPYVADLFWSSATNGASDSLTAAGFNQPFSTITLFGGGYFVAGTRTIIGAAGAILAQVRVWDMTSGMTYSQARDAGGEFGFSNLILFTLSIPPGAATPMSGLQGFQLERIPEPSAAALIFVSVVALLLCHRASPKSDDLRQRT